MKFNELGRSFFRKMVQICRYFATMCTIRSTRGAKLPVDATFSGSLERGLDKVISRGEKNFSVHKKYMNFFQYRKTALDEPLYKLSAGRSMVEMLGVLAIIGVLSVGAIAGYSKAMMKYRLNKQSEQLNYILSNLEMADINIARENISSDNVKYLFSQLGIIPDEMIKDNSIYDAMNNKISISVNNLPSFQSFLMLITLSPFSMESCVNIYNVAKAHSNTMWQIALRTSTSEGYDYKNRTFGDNYCAPSTTTCIKDTDMSYIQNFCGACLEGEDCSFALFLAYQNS